MTSPDVYMETLAAHQKMLNDGWHYSVPPMNSRCTIYNICDGSTTEVQFWAPNEKFYWKKTVGVYDTWCYVFHKDGREGIIWGDATALTHCSSIHSASIISINDFRQRVPTPGWTLSFTSTRNIRCCLPDGGKCIEFTPPDSVWSEKTTKDLNSWLAYVLPGVAPEEPKKHWCLAQYKSGEHKIIWEQTKDIERLSDEVISIFRLTIEQFRSYVRIPAGWSIDFSYIDNSSAIICSCGPKLTTFFPTETVWTEATAQELHNFLARQTIHR